MQPVSRARGDFSRPFADRVEAGRALAARLAVLKPQDPVVVGLPRGGVVVAAEVARILQVPLEIVVVRKIAVPWNPELAVGAVGEGGIQVRNEDLLSIIGVSSAAFQAAAEEAAAQVQTRSRRLRGGRRPLDVGGRNVILVDDGIATGATAEAAIRVLKAQGAATVLLAAPVATPDAVARLKEVADGVVVVDAPRRLESVGAWYADFSEVTDDQVLQLLQPAAWGRPARPSRDLTE